MKTLGRKGLADLRQVAAAYNAARHADPYSVAGIAFAHAKRLGALASTRGRNGDRPFGPNSRSTRRRAYTERRFAVAGRIGGVVGDDAAAQMLALAESSWAPGASLGDAVKSARAAKLSAQAKSKRDAELTDDAMTWFNENTGKQQLADIEATGYVPKGILRPLPSSSGLQVFMFDPDIGTIASDTNALAGTFSHTGLAAAVEADFREMHTTVMTKDTPPIPPDTRADDAGLADDGACRNKSLPLCRQLGFCRCTDAGLRLYRLQNSVLRQLKARCRPHTANRKLLVDGFIVVRLTTMADGDESLTPIAEQYSGWLVAGRALLRRKQGHRWASPIIHQTRSSFPLASVLIVFVSFVLEDGLPG